MTSWTETVFPEELPREVADELPVGIVLGSRYQVVRVLGKGGSAIVYEARDLDLRRHVALKVMRSDRMTATGLKRFRREVALARDVDCPHLIRVHDVQTLDDRLCISMELVEGETLRAQIAREGQLEIDAALDIFRQILTALVELHRKGIVHRDVKPGNILVRNDGRVSLADLGLALQSDAEESRATMTQGVIGTFEYLSPEQALGQHLDGRSDLYSAGIVLYEMLTGEVPFRAGSSLGMVLARVNTRPRDLRALRGNVPSWLAQMTSGLLERNRDDGYPDADAVLRLLERKRYSLLRGWKSLRHRAAVVAGLVVLAAASFLGWLEWRTTRFDSLTAASDHLVARDSRGRVLWTRNGHHQAGLFRGKGGARMVAAVQNPGMVTVGDEAAYVLQLLDPQSGETRQRIPLHKLEEVFRNFAPIFRPAQMFVRDVDHDGIDEVFIPYGQYLYWPSYTLMYEPKSGDVQIVYIASGHHRIAAAVDLDGDSDEELLFVGINNRMGWCWTMAAVDPVGSRSGARQVVASSPDEEYFASSSRSLLWYKLLPLGLFKSVPDGGGVDVDEKERTIRFVRDDGRPVAVSFNGFSRDIPLDHAQRAVARQKSFAELRRAVRLITDGQPGRALPFVTSGIELARRAGDDELVEWASRVEIRAAIESGDGSRAQQLLDALLKTADARGGVVWDAAVAYHLRGELEEAARLYEIALDPIDNLAGRLRYEYLEGLVLALGEAGEWEKARDAVTRGARLARASDVHAPSYQLYIDWRTGAPRLDHTLAVNAVDIVRYWTLEVMLINGNDVPSVLREIDARIDSGSGSTAMLHSLKALGLARLGRRDEAVASILTAWEKARNEVRVDTHVRAHLDLIYERARSILHDRPAELRSIDDEARGLAERHRIRSLLRRF